MKSKCGTSGMHESILTSLLRTIRWPQDRVETRRPLHTW